MEEVKEQPATLAAAMLQVMQEVKSVEKNMTVGTGRSSYSGVSDKDVKQVIQPAMARAGLVMYPIKIEKKTNVERWQEVNNGYTKQKQQVFCEVIVTYCMAHAASGESVEIVGFGHGVDTMDKAPGKATTYALKYALLYTFLIPTGAIDDTDQTHSDEQPTAPTKQGLTDNQFTRACNAIDKGEYTIEALRNDYALNEQQLEELKQWETKK